jgi:hypothetical protein
MVIKFVITDTEARDEDGGAEPAHRTMPALDLIGRQSSSMRQVAPCPVAYFSAQLRPDRAWVAVVATRSDTGRRQTGLCLPQLRQRTCLQPWTVRSERLASRPPATGQIPPQTVT